MYITEKVKNRKIEYSIYCLQPQTGLRNHSYYCWKDNNRTPYIDMYDKAYSGTEVKVVAYSNDNTKRILENIWYMFNHYFPKDYVGRSLSVGDVIKLNDEYYFVDIVGFEKLENFVCDYLDDSEKMRDMLYLTKEEFLRSYSYLTEEEYDLTKKRMKPPSFKGVAKKDIFYDFDNYGLDFKKDVTYTFEFAEAGEFYCNATENGSGVYLTTDDLERDFYIKNE